MPYGKILTAMSYGFFFRALDEEKRLYQPDVDLRKALSEDFESVLVNNLAIDPVAFRFVIKELKKLYLALQKDLKT
jgi:hypothetical protein